MDRAWLGARALYIQLRQSTNKQIQEMEITDTQSLFVGSK